MILALSIRLAGRTHAYLYAYAPSNVFIRYLRSDEGRRWALPFSAALAAGYLAATAGLNTIIESGGHGWLNMAAALCGWNAIKFAWVGVGALAGTVSLKAASLNRRISRVRSDRSRGDVGETDKTGITLG